MPAYPSFGLYVTHANSSWVIRFMSGFLSAPITAQSQKSSKATTSFANFLAGNSLFRNSILPSHRSLEKRLVGDALSCKVTPVLALADDPFMPPLDEIDSSTLRHIPFWWHIITWNLVTHQIFLSCQWGLTRSSCNTICGTSLMRSSLMTSERLPKLVILISLVDIILYHIHDSPLAGHPGRDISLRQAQRSYFWQSMRKDIFQLFPLL